MPLICSGRSPPPRFSPGPEKSYAAIASNACARDQVSYLGIDAAHCGRPWNSRQRRTSRSAFLYGSGCSRTALTTEKMAAFAPIPSARAATATRLKRGFLNTARKAYFRSAASPCIVPLYVTTSIAVRGRIALSASAPAADTPAPIKAYHVHPTAPVHHTQASTTPPSAIPAIIADALTRRVLTPTRNAPSTGPVVSESTDSPASSTDWLSHCAPSATMSCTIPQKTVSCFDSRSSFASSGAALT